MRFLFAIFLLVATVDFAKAASVWEYNGSTFSLEAGAAIGKFRYLSARPRLPAAERTVVFNDQAPPAAPSSAQGERLVEVPASPNAIEAVHRAAVAAAEQIFNHQDAAAAPSPAQDERLVELSASLISTYEAVHLAALAAAGQKGEDLRPVAAEYRPLLDAFHESVSKLKKLPSQGVASTDRILSLLDTLDSSLNPIHAALVKGDRPDLLRNLATAGYAIEALREAVEALAPPGEDTQDFNELTHIRIDKARHQVEFFGKLDPYGPRQAIPYDQLLAAALGLPEERGRPGEVGSVPGFSLEPTGTFDPEAISRKLINEPEQVAQAANKYFASKMSDEDFRNQLFAQAWDDVRSAIAALLYQRMNRAEVDALVGPTRNMDELGAVLRQLVERGVLSKDDVPAFSQAIQAGFVNYMTRKGSVLALPAGSFENIMQVRMSARPAFFGVASDTQFARVVFESDVELKSLIGPAGRRLKQKLPYHRTLLDWFYARPLEELASLPRLWVIQIRPDSLKIAGAGDQSMLIFDKTLLRIDLRNRENQPTPETLIKYADFLTSHYDDYAHQFPSLWEMRELAKISAAAHYLKDQGFTYDIPVDQRWRAPADVDAQWDFAFLGRGPGVEPIPGAIFAGGIDLQTRSRTQLRKVSDSQIAAFLRANPPDGGAWRAGGYPIATTGDRLANLDYSDAKSNLRAMTGDELKALKVYSAAREQHLAKIIDDAKRKEFAASLRVSSPAEFATWKGVMEEKLLTVSGVKLMQDLARLNAQQLADAVKQGVQIPKDLTEAVKRYQKIEKEVNAVEKIRKTATNLLDGTTQRNLQKLLGVKEGVILNEAEIARLLTAKLTETQQIQRLITKGFMEESRAMPKLVRGAVSVGWEMWEVRREIAESKNFNEAATRIPPHVGSIIKELLPNTGELIKIARTVGSDPAEVARFGTRASIYLKVGEVALSLGFEAANLHMINEGIRRERADNRILLYDISGARADFERKLNDNRRVQQLILEEERSRSR